MLPPKEHFQYFSHLFHSGDLIPYVEYSPDLSWDYPASEQHRFDLYLNLHPEYLQNKHVVDLGCHHGFLSYAAKLSGAESVHGVNIREYPLQVANYAFAQFNQNNYKFEYGDLEDVDFLTTVCNNKDTAIFTDVLEHTRNPYKILEIISNSDIENLIFSCSVAQDSYIPALTYFSQSTESAFTVHEQNKKRAICCYPNTAWLDLVLYHLGWKIEYYEVKNVFKEEWFAVPNLTNFPPMFLRTAYVLATKFNKERSKNNFEYD